MGRYNIGDDDTMTYTLKYKGIREIVGRKHVIYEFIIEEGLIKFTFLQTKEEIEELVNVLKNDGWF